MDELSECKLPVDEPEHPRDDTGLRFEPESLFWQL